MTKNKKPTVKTSKTPVVVADDDSEILTMLAQHLRAKGMDVVECSDGEQALAAVEKYRPELVVLDVMMPGMSGWEVCKRIRENKKLSDTRVLVLTAIGERLNEMTSPLYGADDYLDKPFEFTDLDKKISFVLKGNRAAKR